MNTKSPKPTGISSLMDQYMDELKYQISQDANRIIYGKGPDVLDVIKVPDKRKIARSEVEGLVQQAYAAGASAEHKNQRMMMAEAAYPEPVQRFTDLQEEQIKRIIMSLVENPGGAYEMRMYEVKNFVEDLIERIIPKAGYVLVEQSDYEHMKLAADALDNLRGND